MVRVLDLADRRIPSCFGVTHPHNFPNLNNNNNINGGNNNNGGVNHNILGTEVGELEYIALRDLEWGIGVYS